MRFYTNVTTHGDNICVRGYNNGNPFKTKIDFSPTMYVTSKENNSKFKTLGGTVVDEIQPGSIRDTKDFIKRYEGVDGYNIYGNTNFTYQYISDLYYKKTVDFDINQIRIYSIDIETTTEEGFTDIKTANEAVLLITVKDSVTKDIITFGYKPFDNKRKDVKYVLCNNEQHLLKEFIIFWQQNCPDIVTGWNTRLFDIPYLIRRIERELGESFSNKLSPWGYVREKKVFIKGTEEITYTIPGVAQLDYLDLYKKFKASKQESYRLDYIAEVELNDKKLENPHNSFKEFYDKDWQLFVEYNIHDTELVDRLEDKMNYIVIVITMAYKAKINYEDVFSQVRMWDSIVYNYLRDKDVVIPLQSHSSKDEQFEGAYVKDVLVGLHRYISSVDLDALYPHLIMQYNISPETLTHVKIDCTVEKLLNEEVDLSYIHENNLSMTANGWCYRKDIKGFIPEIVYSWYEERKLAKNQMLAYEQEYENDKSKKHLLNEISRLNNLQHAIKIALNSIYGAMGNQYFRYFDIRMAEGITMSGQLGIRWMGKAFNITMNKIMGTVDNDYIIASDTDSIYLTMETMIEKFYPSLSVDDKIKQMDKICNDIYQPLIKKTYQKLADYMNAYEQKMKMKREVLAEVGLWTAKKKYILLVHNSEGVQYKVPKIKIVGLEMIKSSTPAVIRQKLKDAIPIILSGDEKILHKFVSAFRNEFNTLPVHAIAFPRGVNGIRQYAGSPIYTSGTPIAVRGSLLYNHYVKKLDLKKVHQLIKDGDKIKFIYVKKPNPFQENVIAFPQFLPKEFKLEKFIDYDLQFEKTFLDALQIILTPIGWNAEEQASLESFFG